MRRVVVDARCAPSRLCRSEAGTAGCVRAEGTLMDGSAKISGDARPRLPRGVRLAQSEAHGGWVLLAPERVFKADTVTVEILRRCTGTSTLEEIVDDLAKAFEAPRERIHADVVNLLGTLADKKLLEV